MTGYTPKSRISSLHPVMVVVINIFICSLLALFLWLMISELNRESYWTVWTYSQCIGQTLCIMMLSWSYFLSRRPPIALPIRAAAFMAIVLTGYVLGRSLAGWILGHPVSVIPTESVFLGSLMLSVIMAVGSTWYYSTRENIARLQLQASEAQLSMLKAQIEPHMLFNTLANLRVLITKNPTDAQHLLDQLIEFLRATLDGSRTAEGTVEAEFKILENYLALMKIRFGERLNYHLHMPPSVGDFKLPSLLLQPLVENAIKHGIEPYDGIAHLDVNAVLLDKELLLSVKNTGVPMKSSDDGGGFGLKSVRERLNETYRTGASITFESPLSGDNGGTLVTINVPVSYD